MRITFAMVLLCVWFATMVFALGGAIWACAKKGTPGLGPAVLMVLGGLLTFGPVSAVVGLYEMADYARHVSFWGSLALGLIGLTILVTGFRRAR